MTSRAVQPKGRLDLPPGTGRAGEAAAEAYLRQRGYKVLACNYRTREGEIDIVARHQGVYVFVEVRTRRSRYFGLPEESLTAAKAERLLATARTYLADHDVEGADWRVDLVAVELDRFGRPMRIELFENAITE